MIHSKYSVLFLIPFVFVNMAQEKTIEQIMQEEQEKLKQIQQETLDYQDQVEAEFKFYQESISKEYEEYENQLRREMEEQKKEILKKWAEYRGDDPTEMVDYDDDLNARSTVDFKKGTIEVEVISEPNKPNIDAQAKARLLKKLQEVAALRTADNKPVLQKQIKTEQGVPVTKSNAKKFAEKAVEKQKIEKAVVQSRDGKKRIKFKVKVKLESDHIEKRASEYKPDVNKQCRRFDVEPGVAMAVMHTESYFNPLAKSHVPAFGLMQLVPKSGARDAYNYVYRKDKLLKADYLYVPKNNIELGCAYIAKVRNVYFKKITDDEKAYYCAIAAYNTGPGNVAKAITGTTSLSRTCERVNQRSAKWVYDKLLKDLPYKETKNYLQKVTTRRQLYDKWMKQ